MLDYIKQQLAAQQAAMIPERFTEDDENALIAEYAHIFQELDDISVEGKDAYRARSLELEIPIEDDIELDTVELNLRDGRVVDVPMDAIINQENFVENMKTYADFYLEACDAVKPFMREDAYNLEERRQAWAKKRYDVYHEKMIQEGMYGFDKLSMDDEHVPTNVMCDYGLLGVDDVQKYMVKSPVYFESADGNVVASQLTTLQVAKNEHIFESFAEALANKLSVHANEVWDVATPKRVIVPVPKDEYHIIVEFDCEGMDESQYIGWKMSRKPSVRNGNIPENMYPTERSSEIVAAIPLLNKKEYVKESYVTPVKKVPSRWDHDEVYQESTKGFVTGVTLLEILTAGVIGVGIGAGAGALINMLPNTILGILGTIGVSAGSSAGAMAAGSGVALGGNYVIVKNIDKVMVKSISKDIAKVVAILNTENGNESVAKENLKKFKKASKALAKEIRYNLPSDKKHFQGVLNVRKLPDDLASKLTELADLADKAANFVDFDNEEDNKKFLKEYLTSMNSVVEMMFEKKVESSYDDKETTTESYQYDSDSLYAIVQEAIDFGYPDEQSEAANKNQPADAPQVQNTDIPPELNSGESNNDQPTVDGDAPPADNPQENTPGEPVDGSVEEPKNPVETNDVSDQIAENISKQTTGDTGADANGDINLDDVPTDLDDTTNADGLSNDPTSTDNIDSELNGLDANGSGMTDAPMGDPSTMNIDSMSIDDILTQASEKLKTMPIEQVKKFLTDGAGGLDDTSTPPVDDIGGIQTESYQMEAFFITKKNVKQELDVAIRGCLGALNDSYGSLNDIIGAFKKHGKKLNRVLGKAIRMTDVFSVEQTNHLNKLNSALVKLQTGLKPTSSTEETNAVKALIKDFTSEAVVVGKFLENSNQKDGE